jgi:synaptotagmin-like protein
MPDTASEAGMQYKGDLVVSLMYVTPDKVVETKKAKRKSKGGGEQMGQIHAMIKTAKNLTAVRSNGTSDPFVKG